MCTKTNSVLNNSSSSSPQEFINTILHSLEEETSTNNNNNSSNSTIKTIQNHSDNDTNLIYRRRRRQSRIRHRRIRQHAASVLTELLDGSSSSSAKEAGVVVSPGDYLLQNELSHVEHHPHHHHEEGEEGGGWQDSTLADEVLLEILPLDILGKKRNEGVASSCSACLPFQGEAKRKKKVHGGGRNGRIRPLTSPSLTGSLPPLKRSYLPKETKVYDDVRRRKRPLTSFSVSRANAAIEPNNTPPKGKDLSINKESNITKRNNISDDKEQHHHNKVRWSDSIEENATSNNALLPPLETDSMQQEQQSDDLSKKKEEFTFVTLSQQQEEEQQQHQQDNKNCKTATPKNTAPNISRRKALLINRPNHHHHHHSTTKKNPKNSAATAAAIQTLLPPTREQMHASFHQRDNRIHTIQKRRAEQLKQRETQLTLKLQQNALSKMETMKLQKLHFRQTQLLEIISLTAITTSWFDLSVRAYEKYKIQTKWNDAAKSIQRLWRAELFIRNAKNAMTVHRKLKKIGWRLRVWSRCTRRRLHAQLLRTFLEDFSVQQLNYIMYTFRYRVMKAQRIMRTFMECQRARRYVLERHWGLIEREVKMAQQQQQKQNKGSNCLGNRKGSSKDGKDGGGGGGGGGSSSSKRRKNDMGMLKATPQRKKKSRWNKLQIQSRAMLTLAAGLQTVRDKKTAQNALDDSETIKFLCRYHLEDERRLHIDQSTKMLIEVAHLPAINVSHAKLLLSGERVNVDFEGKRSWPPFLVYASSRKRLKKLVEALVRDGENVKRRIDERIAMDRATVTANRYAAGEAVPSGDDGSDNEEKVGDDAEESKGSDVINGDSKMAKNSELEENNHLAHRYKISTNEVQELREIFQLVDLDGGGTISVDEMGKLLDLLGMHKDDDEIHEILSSIDKTDDDVEVNFPDFVKALKGNRPNPPYTEAMVQRAFQSFAKGMPSGRIKNEQLSAALTSYTGRWDEKKALVAMRDVGLIGHVIDYHQFVHVMFQLCQG